MKDPLLLSRFRVLRRIGLHLSRGTARGWVKCLIYWHLPGTPDEDGIGHYVECIRCWEVLEEW